MSSLRFKRKRCPRMRAAPLIEAALNSSGSVRQVERVPTLFVCRTDKVSGPVDSKQPDTPDGSPKAPPSARGKYARTPGQRCCSEDRGVRRTGCPWASGAWMKAEGLLPSTQASKAGGEQVLRQAQDERQVLALGFLKKPASFMLRVLPLAKPGAYFRHCLGFVKQLMNSRQAATCVDHRLQDVQQFGFIDIALRSGRRRVPDRHHGAPPKRSNTPEPAIFVPKFGRRGGSETPAEARLAFPAHIRHLLHVRWGSAVQQTGRIRLP
jgi:hypothetical protein